MKSINLKIKFKNSYIFSEAIQLHFKAVQLNKFLKLYNCKKNVICNFNGKYLLKSVYKSNITKNWKKF